MKHPVTDISINTNYDAKKTKRWVFAFVHRHGFTGQKHNNDVSTYASQIKPATIKRLQSAQNALLDIASELDKTRLALLFTGKESE